MRLAANACPFRPIASVILLRSRARIGLCRDPERAPMRWDDSPSGDFTIASPWLPLERPT